MSTRYQAVQKSPFFLCSYFVFKRLYPQGTGAGLLGLTVFCSAAFEYCKPSPAAWSQQGPFPVPRLRNRRKFISAFIIANAPSACMLRFTRSCTPSLEVILFRSSWRWRRNYLDTSNFLVLSSSGVLQWFPCMHWLFTGQLLQSEELYRVMFLLNPVRLLRTNSFVTDSFLPWAQR